MQFSKTHNSIEIHSKVSPQVSDKRIHFLISLSLLVGIITMNISNAMNKQLIKDANNYDIHQQGIIFDTTKRTRIDDTYGLNNRNITEVADPTKRYNSLHQFTVILRSTDPHMMTLDGFTATLRANLDTGTYRKICSTLYTKWG
eukprot:415809_1